MTKAADLPHRIAIIGAGWAGCAAAVTLAKAGRQVSLFEAARTLGGRARRIDSDGRQLDNGQHILLGAYRTTLKLMKTVGIDLQQSMLRLPLQMRYPAACDGMDFVAPKLPAPWHVAVALLPVTPGQAGTGTFFQRGTLDGLAIAR
jgi:predicted NAD/FAD-binding protein